MDDSKTQDEGLDAIVNVLDDTDKEIIRYKWQNPKLSLTDIGNLLGLSKQAIHYRLKKDKVKEAIDYLEKDIIFHLKQAQGEAVKVFLKTLKSSDQKLAYQAAKDLLQQILATSPHLLAQSNEDKVLEFINES